MNILLLLRSCKYPDKSSDNRENGIERAESADRKIEAGPLWAGYGFPHPEFKSVSLVDLRDLRTYQLHPTWELRNVKCIDYISKFPLRKLSC